MASKEDEMTPTTVERQPELLLTHEVAEMLRCSPRRLHELVAEGRLRPLRLTAQGHMRFRRDEIEALIRGEVRTR